MLGMKQPGGMHIPPSQSTLGISTGEMGAAPLAYLTQAYPGAQGMVDPRSNVAYRGRQSDQDTYLVGQSLNRNGVTASAGQRVAEDGALKAAQADASTREEQVRRLQNDYLLTIISQQGGDMALMNAATINPRPIALGKLQSMGMDDSTIGGKIARNMMA